MSLRTTLRTATLAGLLLLPVPHRLAACAFHTALPEATVSQQIAGAIEVVAARPAADNKFRFEPVAVLKGAASASRPPHLVDSATRARLARNRAMPCSSRARPTVPGPGFSSSIPPPGRSSTG
jgi:hypothetical protein